MSEEYVAKAKNKSAKETKVLVKVIRPITLQFDVF